MRRISFSSVQREQARFSDFGVGFAPLAQTSEGEGAYSLNQDPLSIQGRLQGVPSDLALSGSIQANCSDATILMDGATPRLARFAPDTVELSTGDLYSSVDGSSIGTVVSSKNRCAMQSRDGQLFMAGGPDVLDVPRWYGKLQNGYWLGSNTGMNAYVLEDAEYRNYRAGTLLGSGPGVRLYYRRTFATTANNPLPASSFVFLGYSLVYDGYAESPLVRNVFTQTASGVPTFTAVSSGGASLSVEVRVYYQNMSKRVTHLKVYAALGSTSNSPDTLYRLVGILSFVNTTGNGAYQHTGRFYKDDVTTFYTDPSTAYWGGTYTGGETAWLPASSATPAANQVYELVIDAALGADYESESGISEQVDSNIVHYTISSVIENAQVVGECYNPAAPTEDWSPRLVLSEPFRYAQFDWVENYLTLKSAPVALQGHEGRVYAFTKSDFYRITTSPFAIEDVLEGMGCSWRDAVISTDYGMFWANNQNIYRLTDRVEIISGVIAKTDGDNLGWQEITKSSVWCCWDEQRMCICFYVNASGTYYCYAYQVSTGRWFLWEAPAVIGVLQGNQGEPILLVGTSVNQALRDSTRRLFRWRSGRIYAGQSTHKHYSAVEVVTDGSGSVELSWSRESSPAWASLTTSPGLLTLPSAPVKERWIRLELEAQSLSPESHSLTAYFYPTLR